MSSYDLATLVAKPVHLVERRWYSDGCKLRACEDGVTLAACFTSTR